MTRADPSSLPQVHLTAGRLVVTREPKIVVTVLGSCVAVTMFHRSSGLAAMCHAMFAQPQSGETVPSGGAQGFRYVSRVLPAMIAIYRRAAVPLRAIEVKLFGGGNVIGHGPPVLNGWFGLTSVETAREILENAGIAIGAESSGGQHGRKILFNTATGEVLHKRLRRSIVRPDRVEPAD